MKSAILLLALSVVVAGCALGQDIYDERRVD